MKIEPSRVYYSLIRSQCVHICMFVRVPTRVCWCVWRTAVDIWITSMAGLASHLVPGSSHFHPEHWDSKQAAISAWCLYGWWDSSSGPYLHSKCSTHLLESTAFKSTVDHVQMALWAQRNTEDAPSSRTPSLTYLDTVSRPGCLTYLNHDLWHSSIEMPPAVHMIIMYCAPVIW